MEDRTIREYLSTLTTRYGPPSTAVATGPAMNALAYFGELAPYRPDLYLESKLWSPTHEPIPVTRMARSQALGGDVIVPVYAIDLQTGVLDIDYYRDSTSIGHDPAYYSGRGRYRSRTELWRPLHTLARALGPSGEFNAYREGGGYRLPHHVETLSSTGFPDPELWPDVEERWRSTVSRLINGEIKPRTAGLPSR